MTYAATVGVRRDRSSALVLCLAAALVFAPGLAAQRQPVLKQIALPHNYYYREMYLPQVTSGPSAAAWLPDGRSLVISMQGSLWRVWLEGDSAGTAVQLTTGPSYDYQPDVSPDGRRVVYASYHGDAVELRTLDLQTLDGGPLVANGAVNVEPRWSPDGSRIAYVSTAYAGRFHVWLAQVDGSSSRGGAMALPLQERLTDDVDSQLPRYYYSRYDHYLSPTWSPDGRELILVSNRGRIWGTGGLWRMAAIPGAPLRPVLDEETTWRARPAWSPEGRRVVYASYLGRQWHQLWLTTPEGGDPFQLTYGEFDATAPRWSPDGTRIAFVSNEGGNTDVRLLEIPGGARRTVAIRRRIHREPVGRLVLTILDAAGRPMAARVSVTLPDGRSAAPDDAWRHSDDFFDRRSQRFEYGYFHTSGRATLTVPAGEVNVEVTRGPAYRVARARVTVPANGAATRVFRLSPLLALPGWTAGDLHVHMNYGGHYRATPASLAFMARAEGVGVVENLVVNKEDRVPDVASFSGRPDPLSNAGLLLLHDQEFHTSFWGHVGLLGLTRNLELPGYAGYAGTPAASLYPDNATVADMARAQGALVGYVHPFDEIPAPADTSVPLTNALPVDVALGKVDYFEVVGFSDHLATSAVWYRLLNCGFRLPAGAGTDAMTNYASLRGPVGMNRVYVESGLPLDRSRWYAALRAGKTFATNGPLLQFSLGAAGIGGELRLPAGARLPARVRLSSWVPVDHLQIIGNGRVVADLPLAGDRTAADTTVMLDVQASGWYILRAYADGSALPVLDGYPFGTTSPVYVTVAARPVRSRVDAEWFIAWIDRVAAAASVHTGWNTAEERRTVLGHIAAARAEFVTRADPTH